jgi:hypothetical protein
MTDGHEPDQVSLPVDRIGNAKSANAKLPESPEFAEQWLATFWVGGDRANGEFDRSFQVGMN